MGCVYGDSTIFPHGADFIETIRHAVEQGVALLAAQDAITTAVARIDAIDKERLVGRTRLQELADAVAVTTGGFGVARASDRVVRVAARVLDDARGMVDAEVAAMDAQAMGETSSNRAAGVAAREAAFRAVESFVLRHDLPGTEVGLRLVAGESSYSGEALVTTPFGIEAIFDLAIPSAHEWGRPRRVVELSAGTEVHVPRESGFFSKRIEPHLVKLDRLYVSEVAISEGRTLISLRKGPHSGTGYSLEVLTDGAVKAVLRHLTEAGEDGPADPLTLGGEDGVHVLRLWNRVIDSTRDLATRREAMTEAMFDGKPVRELDEPRLVCERLVALLAPIVQEIARRSGAPGELVLRRDVGEGRREEVYITTAELHEKVLALPPPLQELFAPFELRAGPRSPRAPAHSEPIEELEPDEMEVTVG